MSPVRTDHKSTVLWLDFAVRPGTCRTTRVCDSYGEVLSLTGLLLSVVALGDVLSEHFANRVADPFAKRRSTQHEGTPIL